MLSLVLQFILQLRLIHGLISNNDYLDVKADVIRIKNNGSQFRTIFLPIGSSAKEEIAVDHLEGNSKFVLISQNVNNSEHGDNSIIKNIDHKINVMDEYMTNNKMFLKGNHLDHKNLKEIQSINRTLPVEYKINTDKIAKMLNIITIVNFSNEVCHTTDGLVGVCYHPLECKTIGGHSLGPCAQGYGVCCYVEKTCGESSGVNNTYVTSSGIGLDSETGVYICTIQIHKTSPDVQQLRLNFDVFELAGPVNGNCVIDRFVVTGQNDNNIIPPLCGFNTGKHVYVDVDEVDRPIMLSLLSSGAHGVPSNFNVRVTQLRKHDYLRAPNNCLQYYTESRGSVESFNYLSHNHTAIATHPGYFNNLNYAICFKKMGSHCGIVYSNVAGNGMENIFELVNVEIDGTETVPLGQAGAEVFDCPDDYISLSGIRLCGYKLNDGSVQVDYSTNYPVTDYTNGPLILTFHTNNNVTGKGFHLDYMLIPCSSGPMSPQRPPPPTLTTLSGQSPPAATRATPVLLNHFH